MIDVDENLDLRLQVEKPQQTVQVDGDNIMTTCVYTLLKSQPEVLIEVDCDIAGDVPSGRSMTEVASFDRDHLLRNTQRAAIYSELELC